MLHPVITTQFNTNINRFHPSDLLYNLRPGAWENGQSLGTEIKPTLSKERIPREDCFAVYCTKRVTRGTGNDIADYTPDYCAVGYDLGAYIYQHEPW